MSVGQNDFSGVLAKLAQYHDELKLQTHLFKAEVQDEWNKAEKNWNRLERDMDKLKRAGDKSLEEVGAATHLLVESIQESFHRIKQSIN